jgi:hypothetical protein
MAAVVSARSRSNTPEFIALMAGFAAIALGAVLLDHVHWLGVVLLVAGGVVLALTLSTLAATPSLELLADGKASWRQRLVSRVRGEGAWLFRQSIASLIGFGLGVAATVLYQNWFD